MFKYAQRKWKTDKVNQSQNHDKHNNTNSLGKKSGRTYNVDNEQQQQRNEICVPNGCLCSHLGKSQPLQIIRFDRHECLFMQFFTVDFIEQSSPIYRMCQTRRQQREKFPAKKATNIVEKHTHSNKHIVAYSKYTNDSLLRFFYIAIVFHSMFLYSKKLELAKRTKPMANLLQEY